MLEDLGKEVGLSVQNIIDLLNGGLSLSELLKVIAAAKLAITSI
jgi:hypothetical protein